MKGQQVDTKHGNLASIARAWYTKHSVGGPLKRRKVTISTCQKDPNLILSLIRKHLGKRKLQASILISR